jgi:hypothetical protein
LSFDVGMEAEPGRGFGEEEFVAVAVFGAFDEEDAVAEAVPGGCVRPAVVTEEDDLSAGLRGGFQDFGSRAKGVFGVLGVDVDGGTVTAVDADLGTGLTLAGQGFAGCLDGREAFGLEAFEGRVLAAGLQFRLGGQHTRGGRQQKQGMDGCHLAGISYR